MNLLMDVGNSRVKWAWSEDGGLEDPDQLDRPELPGESSVLDVALGATGNRPSRILAANVAGNDYGRALNVITEELFGRPIEFVATTASAHGVINGYPQPELLGVDRWVSLVAAFHHQGGPVCVVDAGSACTIDALDATGRHLGGVIVPGLGMMERALRADTGDLAERSDRSGRGVPGIFATDTRAAIRSGCRYALAALADRAVSELTTGLSSAPRVVVAGGDGAELRGYMTTATLSAPDLVLQGLALFAEETP